MINLDKNFYSEKKNGGKKLKKSVKHGHCKGVNSTKVGVIIILHFWCLCKI